jgi:hypothetical protein
LGAWDTARFNRSPRYWIGNVRQMQAVLEGDEKCRGAELIFITDLWVKSAGQAPSTLL